MNKSKMKGAKKQGNAKTGKKVTKKSAKVKDHSISEEHVGATQKWIVEDDDDALNSTIDLDDDAEENVTDLESEDICVKSADATESPVSETESFKFLGIDDEDDDDETPDYVGEKGLTGEEMNNGKRFNLLEAARAIIPTKKNPMKRKEAAKNVEEFVAVKRRINVGEGGVNKFLESVKEAGDTKTAEKVAKLQATTENQKNIQQKRIQTLDAPAEKITSEKIKRTLLYDNAKTEVSKWNSVVYHNREAEQLVFPLSDDNRAFKKPPKNKDGTEFMPITPLDVEIAKVLYGEAYVERKKAEMSKDPEKTNLESYLLSVEEAMATHSEMAKLRALQSYAMAKAKRQSKIKSKKYHRLLRKSKIKQQMKEFEELQKKDPEAALVKLEELETARVQERMSLKHRNTSKWAKMHAARAKYDKDSRIALSEQLKISKDLTQKVQESSDDEDEEDMQLPLLVRSSVENPWMLKSSLQENEKLKMYYTGYRKFWEEYNRQLGKQNKSNVENAGDDSSTGSESDLDDNNDDIVETKVTKTNKRNLESEDSSPNAKRSRSRDGDADEFREFNVNEDEINTEGVTEEFEHDSVSVLTKQGISNPREVENNKQQIIEKTVEVDPDKFLKVNKTGSSINQQFNAHNSKVVDLLEDSDESDDDTDQRNLIAEAFEDDDVVNDFHKLKKDTVNAAQPQDIDDSLPGWGSWTGKNVVPNKKKRKRFIKKAKKGPLRKDARASHVIINEDVDAKVRTHQVKELPFPFTRVKDFEKIIRAPVGRTWMPETAVKSLTAPKVITRLGQTIKPISEDFLAKPKEKKFHVPNTILRMAKVTTKK